VLDLIARHFDGVILQTLYGIADMKSSLARLEAARASSPLGEPLLSESWPGRSNSPVPQSHLRCASDNENNKR
jgi:hypothetical protein